MIFNSQEKIFCWARANPVLATALIVVFARLPFILEPSLSLDDYKYLTTLPPKDLLISQGRFGWLVVERLAYFFGLSGPYWYVHATIFGLVSLAAVGVFTARVAFKLEHGNGSLSIVIVAVMFALHPYHAEIITFREAFPFYALAMLLVSVGINILVAKTGFESLLLGTMFLLVALSINQLALNLVAVVFLTRALISTLSGDRIWDEGAARLALSSACAALTIITCIFVASQVYGVELESRAQILDYSRVSQRLSEVVSVASDLIQFKLLYPIPILSALLAFLCLVGVVRLLSRAKTWSARAVMIVLILVLPFASIGVVAAGTVFWAPPRTMVGFVFVTAFLLAFSVHGLHGRLRAFSSCISVLIALAFIGIGDTVALDQSRINQRDQATAIAIAARVDKLSLQKIAFVGTWRHELGLRTRVGDISLSAFAISWARGPAMLEYTGRIWEIVEPNNVNLLREACNGLPVWPHEDSVNARGDLALICL